MHKRCNLKICIIFNTSELKQFRWIEGIFNNLGNIGFNRRIVSFGKMIPIQLLNSTLEIVLFAILFEPWNKPSMKHLLN